MLLAQAKELTDVTQKAIQSAEVYGLIGYLLVAVFLVAVIFTGAILKFFAPRVSNIIASTIDLHTSIKETNIKQTALIDSIRADHGEKLSDIKEVVRALQPCPYAAPKPFQPVPPNLTPISHGS